MAYTVTVVLEVKAGFEFTGATTAKVNDEAATIASWSAGTLTATYTFPKTAAEMHTVTFDANGGSGTMEAQEANIPTALKRTPSNGRATPLLAGTPRLMAQAQLMPTRRPMTSQLTSPCMLSGLPMPTPWRLISAAMAR